MHYGKVILDVGVVCVLRVDRNWVNWGGNGNIMVQVLWFSSDQSYVEGEGLRPC